jgi:hypothetical protein
MRVPVTSCATADSLIGAAPRGVLRAEVHGGVGPGSAFELRSGPLSTHDLQPILLKLSSAVTPVGRLPGGYLTVFFPASILGSSTEQAEPMQIVLDDSTRSPLSTPRPPSIAGPTPPTLPYTALLRPDDARALVQARKARVEFLGRKAVLDQVDLNQFQATWRLAVCHLASLASPP